MHEHKNPSIQNLEHPEVSTESYWDCYVSNAKSRSSLQLSLRVAFVVFISIKHSEESHSERQLPGECKLSIYLSQPFYLIVIFCASLFRINTNIKEKNFLKFKPLIS